MENKKVSPLKLSVCFKAETGDGDFIQVPRMWVDRLMNPAAFGGKSPRIPNSFWKYTLVLWRGIAGGNFSRETKMAVSEFPVRRAAAVRWAAAYSVSGLFQVNFGTWTPKHDNPTHFRYRAGATAEEWEAFIVALDCTLAKFKQATRCQQIRLQEDFNLWGNTPAFKIMLAQQVDIQRRARGLSAVNEKILKQPAAPILPKNRRIPADLWDGHPKGCMCQDCTDALAAWEAAEAEVKELSD